MDKDKTIEEYYSEPDEVWIERINNKLEIMHRIIEMRTKFKKENKDEQSVD
jgi:hypothetical protein